MYFILKKSAMKELAWVRKLTTCTVQAIASPINIEWDISSEES